MTCEKQLQCLLTLVISAIKISMDEQLDHADTRNPSEQRVSCFLRMVNLACAHLNSLIRLNYNGQYIPDLMTMQHGSVNIIRILEREEDG